MWWNIVGKSTSITRSASELGKISSLKAGGIVGSSVIIFRPLARNVSAFVIAGSKMPVVKTVDNIDVIELTIRLMKKNENTSMNLSAIGN